MGHPVSVYLFYYICFLLLGNIQGFFVQIGECDLDCGHFGTCVFGDGLIAPKYCHCHTGHEGDRCERTPPCASSPCKNGGVCYPYWNDKFYGCNCQMGFSGHDCEVSHCDSHPCLYGSTCSSKTESPYYTCHCSAGFSGHNCEVTPCDSHPCLYGSACFSKTERPYYSCNCVAGFSGHNCGVSPCDSKPCADRGTCYLNTSSPYYLCKCREGFSGERCDDILTQSTTMAVSTASTTPDTSTIDNKETSSRIASSTISVFTTAPPEHPSIPLTTPNTTPSLTTINEIDNVSSSSPFNASVLTTSLTSISSAYLNTSTSTYMQSTTSTVTTSGPDIKQTCTKFSSVFDVAEKVIETNSLAAPCPSGNNSSPEAYVLNNCDLQPASAWKQGYNVLKYCGVIPTYTPIASFDMGQYSSDGGLSGIFVGCIDNNQGFKMIIQHCDQHATIEVFHKGGTFTRNPYNYFTIEI